MNDKAVQDMLWTVHELAAFLRTSPGSVYKRVERRQVPHVQLGRLLRFRPDEIRDWLERNTVPADDEDTGINRLKDRMGA